MIPRPPGAGESDANSEVQSKRHFTFWVLKLRYPQLKEDFILRYLLTLLLVLTPLLARAELPNLVAKLVEYENGLKGLEGWRMEPETQTSEYSARIVPIDPVFSGAVSHFQSVVSGDPMRSAIEVATGNGMTDAKVVAIDEMDAGMLKPIDPHPDATLHFVTIEGQMGGKPARGVFMNWFGTAGLAEDEPASTGVHYFMAPKDQFEALGGWAIIAIRFLDATATDDTVMVELGRKAPKEAHNELAQMFGAWAVSYVQTQAAITMMMGQTMQIQQQTIQSMQSYNNALSQCGGLGCSMSMDAQGIWSMD